MPSETEAELAAAVERLELWVKQTEGQFPVWPYVARDIGTVLAALPQWKPIETAPRDGTQIMLASINADHSCASSGYWTNHNGGGWVRRIPWEPNYWMKFPQPPQQQQKASEQ